MTKINIKTSISIVLLHIAAIFPSRAQHALDEFRIYSNHDVRLLDINDQGMLCGYFYQPNNGNETGFIVTPGGKLIKLPPISGFSHTRVVSINDRDTPTILIKASNSVGLNQPATLYKSYYFAQGDTISTPTGITLSTTNPNPTKINNKNYMMGWYTTGTGSPNQPRYLWFHFDSTSVMPANHSNQYYSTRYTKPPASFQPTGGGGVNDDGIACGYYYDLDNTNYISYVFDLNTNTFTPFTSSVNRQLLDINNSGFVVGKIVNGSQERAFMGTYNGNMLTSIPVSIFETALTMQSELTGVNNKGEIVGNYLHPTSGKWVGFIYRRNTEEFRLPGFNYNQHTWKIENHADYDANPGDDKIWTNKYYKNNDYNTFDPLSQQAIPVTQNTKYEGKDMASSFTYSWYGFGKETDKEDLGTKATLSAQDSSSYQVTFKPVMLEKCMVASEARTWGATIRVGFLGYCYGFSYTALQRLYDNATYLSWFGPQQHTFAGESDNSDSISILAIERTQIKQSDKKVISKYNVYKYRDVSVWGGMHRLKVEMMKPFDKTNPRGIAIETNTGGWHSVVPYKIKTPQTLPLDYPAQKHDTLFIYDSNKPNDSTQYLLVQNNLSIISDIYNVAKENGMSLATIINFNTPGVRDLPVIHGHGEQSELKPATVNEEDSLYTVYFGGASTYTLKDSNNDSATLAGNVWENNISKILPRVPYNTIPIAYSYLYDTVNMLNIVAKDYDSLAMNWSSDNKNHTIGIYRETNSPDETDYGAARHKYWSYGNPDNITKKLSLHYIQQDNSLDYGVNYRIKDFEARQGDSVITSSPGDYQYRITRIGGDSINYEIKLFIIDNGELRTLDTTLGISGNSTHVYEPYYNGPQGNQLVIYVDNGNTGTYNDTLFLDPTGIEEFINKDYITVYPNPVTDELNIAISKHQSSGYEAVLTDITGKTILNSKLSLQNGSTRIATSMLSPGIYIIQIKQNREMIYRDKVIKR